MSDTLRSILDLLAVEDAGQGTYIGPQPADGRERLRVFGGQVAAQAVMAAARSTPDRRLHSVHVSFLRPGNPKTPLQYDVTALRDGRTFSTRRVSVSQGGVIVMESLVSFIDEIEGAVDQQQTMPRVADPESLPRIGDQLAPYEGYADLVRLRPFDMRYVDPPPRIAVEHGPAADAVCRLWLRVDYTGSPPDTAALLADPLMSTCLLVYVSDWTILDPVQVAIGRTWQNLETMASLDHTMWFHRQIDFSDWVLYDQRSPGAFGGTGLGFGSIYNRDGALVCTVAQEGYLGRRH